MYRRAGESQTVNHYISGARKISLDTNVSTYFCPGGIGGNGGGGGTHGGDGGVGEGPTMNYDINAVENFLYALFSPLYVFAQE
jgi:hypothetical protein